MTGGQAAPTTLIGQKSTTTPLGRSAANEGYPLRMSELLAQLRATHEALFGDIETPDQCTTDELDWSAAAVSASSSHDPHQVKLVEACKRAFDANNDTVFVVAASKAIG